MPWNPMGNLKGPQGDPGDPGDGQFHLLTFDDGWPDRPDDALPAMFIGGVAPDDAPDDGDLRDGDYWLPAVEPGGLAGGGGGGGSVTWSGVSGKPATFPPSGHSHALTDVSGLTDALSGKEPAVATGSNNQFWRGDKTWQELNAAAVAGLGTAATTSSDAYATAAQGTKADGAAQAASLADVATSGAYSDLTGTPTLGTAAATSADAYATAAQGERADAMWDVLSELPELEYLSGVTSPIQEQLDVLAEGSPGGGPARVNPVLAATDHLAVPGEVVFIIADGVTATLDAPAQHGDRIELVITNLITGTADVTWFDLVTQSVTTETWGPRRVIFYYGKDIDIGYGPMSGWVWAG